MTNHGMNGTGSGRVSPIYPIYMYPCITRNRLKPNKKNGNLTLGADQHLDSSKGERVVLEQQLELRSNLNLYRVTSTFLSFFLIFSFVDCLVHHWYTHIDVTRLKHNLNMPG